MSMYVVRRSNIKKWPENIGLPGKNFEATPPLNHFKVSYEHFKVVIFYKGSYNSLQNDNIRKRIRHFLDNIVTYLPLNLIVPM